MVQSVFFLVPGFTCELYAQSAVCTRIRSGKDYGGVSIASSEFGKLSYRFGCQFIGSRGG